MYIVKYLLIYMIHSYGIFIQSVLIVHVWFNPLWIRNIPVRNCANHMLLLMFNIHCGPNMCIAHSGFNGYGMIMYHLLVLVVPSLFEIITWNKAIALEALERCGHSEATCCSLASPLSRRTQVVSSSWPLTEDFWPTPENLVEKGTPCHTTIPYNSW